MRILPYLLLSTSFVQTVASLQASSAISPAQTWNDLRAKREALKGFHQEFDVSRTTKAGEQERSSKWSFVIDGAADRWRERLISGVDDRLEVFDGEESFRFEDQGDEYVRLKRSPKEEAPQPGPYTAVHLEFSKATERGRLPCGLTNVSHECVTIDVPVKPFIGGRGASTGFKVLNGNARLFCDTVTGLLISLNIVQNVSDSHRDYQTNTTYMLKRMSFNNDVDQSLFRVPPCATKEVKELSAWNAERIKKQIAGRAAPDFALTDIHGKTIKLSDLRGKTVLLDFWTTWCGPCRADGPSLDKLHQKYGSKDLAIIGVSVNEDRSVVEKFLSEHGHQYRIALTTENEMPRCYRIGTFPTYIVIDAEGNLVSATQGEKGFSELRHLLKKAGLETD